MEEAIRFVGTSPDDFFNLDEVELWPEDKKFLILDLLSDLQGQLGLTYFIIAHDLATLGHVSARIGIMYLGKIVGQYRRDIPGTIASLYHCALSAMPQHEPGRVKVKASLRGEIGSALNMPLGCRFYPRCEHASHECREQNRSSKKRAPFTREPVIRYLEFPEFFTHIHPRS
jgi:oligopeptide/dipeptide ABC transporter ATP-binding protein